MEKDYFIDRPEDGKFLDKVYPGRKVFICTKSMQKYATKINHLDLVTVTKNLTKEMEHPRGQKVIGVTDEGNQLIGRVVYVLNEEGLVVTKEGLKDLFLDSVEGKYRIYLILKVYDTLNACVLLDRYKFYNTKEEAKKYIMELKPKIGECSIGNGHVKIKIDGEKKDFTDIVYMMNGEINHNISHLQVYDQLYFSGTLAKETNFSFGREYVITAENVLIKKIKGEVSL